MDVPEQKECPRCTARYYMLEHCLACKRAGMGDVELGPAKDPEPFKIIYVTSDFDEALANQRLQKK